VRIPLQLAETIRVLKRLPRESAGVRRDGLPSTVLLDEDIGEPDACTDRRAVQAAARRRPPAHHGCRAEQHHRHVVDRIRVQMDPVEERPEYRGTRQKASVRVRDAPLRRKDALDVGAVLLQPRLSESC
jgi:hypothetical protein